MKERQQHWPEVRRYLKAHISPGAWTFTLPEGSGHETYMAHGAGGDYFVKLGAFVPAYELLAADGLTPEVLSAGSLEDGVPIVVQRYVAGHKPAHADFQNHFERVAEIVRAVHHHSRLQQSLPLVHDTGYQNAAARALSKLRQQWERYKLQVRSAIQVVEDGLAQLASGIANIRGSGLVASHNDICNANWIVGEEGRWYLIDFEAIAWDDPARDLGALLWWYYPPAMWPRFLNLVGYPDDAAFRSRMQVRMAMHCLQIILPRADSFDSFAPDRFGEALTDFRAVLAGEENPQGYS